MSVYSMLLFISKIRVGMYSFQRHNTRKIRKNGKSISSEKGGLVTMEEKRN